MTYAILYHPGHNRVYFDTSIALSASEFAIVSKKFSVPVSDIRSEKPEGLDFLIFESEAALSPKDIDCLCDLSFLYAIFEVIKSEQSPNKVLLSPVRKTRVDFVDDSISQILKYTGKTNEIFTRMMINLAAYSLDEMPTDRPVRLLDPIAGKGTTLYEGLIKGYDVHGIEIGESVVNESYIFVKRFFESAKYKFEHEQKRISGTGKSFTALKHSFVVAPTKEDFKAKNTRILELTSGNSVNARHFYKKNYFDILVGDLPYGVQHGNVTNEKQTSLTRNPSELLDVCLPVWTELLRNGGVMALAWNVNVLDRHKAEKIFEKHGLTVLNDGEYANFEHRVDQAIVRDIIVAKKQAVGQTEKEKKHDNRTDQ